MTCGMGGKGLGWNVVANATGVAEVGGYIGIMLRFAIILT